uniref:Uncharacterized protein n=1 Tax=Lepeophtheirus salmonis TaxID=72036 RepID=A0A0K2T2A0_LEPSM
MQDLKSTPYLSSVLDGSLII